jgi:hypothetical protein
MTVRKAFAKLLSAVLVLATAIVTLLAGLTRLVAALTTWLAVGVEAHIARARATAPRTEAATAPRRPLTLVRPASSLPVGSSQAEKLTSALIGLGFATPNVRRFVAGLGTRVEHEGLETLIKDGLRVLSPAVAL